MLKKGEYIKAVRRQYPPFYFSLMLHGVSDYDNYKNIIKRRFAIRNMIVSNFDVYYIRKEINEGTEFAFNDWKHKKRLENAKKVFKKGEEELLKSASKDFNSFCKSYENYMPALILVWLAEDPVENEIRKLISKKLSIKDTDEMMSALNIPLKNNFYKQEEYDLVTTNDIKKHVKKYEWITSRFGENNPYLVKEAKNRLKEIDKQKFLEDWKYGKEKLGATIKKAKILLKKNGNLIDLMQYIVYYRTQRTDIMNYAGFLFIPHLEEIAKEREITYKELIHCTKEEILDKIPSREVLRKRMKNYAILLEEGKVSCFTGENAKNTSDFISDDYDQVEIIKGTVASGGRVEGKVKKIMNSEDFIKINQGDIIVTSMTTPNMISIMKKASAFITDEGGITCHAAIISREMNKPCIIGTKIATKVLKDGDRVLLDAQSGTIRKI